MIAYNKTWLANLRLQQVVKTKLSRENITNEEFNAIAKKYPVGFYTPNIFVRVGLFLLTCVIVLFADGLISLLGIRAAASESGGWFIFLGLLSYGGLELMLNAKNHYRSGVDDALLYSSACLLTTGIVIVLNHNSSTDYLALSVVLFLLAACFTTRFADMLMAAGCCLAFFAVISFAWIKLPPGVATAPFIMILTSGAVYWAAKKFTSKAWFINYQNCLVVAQVVSLTVLYAAGNYYIVQNLGAEMMGQTGPVKFGWFFWIWTIALPFVYILFGIKHKDVILLRTGLLLITLSVLTFRNYYHLLPVDVMLTIAGVLVLVIVYAITKYLKTPKHGFTNAEPDDINPMDSLKIESLIVAETFSHTGAAPANDGTKFGGGDFGGGGSSAEF